MRHPARTAVALLAPMWLACGGGPDTLPDCVDGTAPTATFFIANFTAEAGADLVVRGETSGPNITAVYVLGTSATRTGIDFTAWQATIPAATLTTHATDGALWISVVAVDACNNRGTPVCPESGLDTGDTSAGGEAGPVCAHVLLPADTADASDTADTGDTAARP